jgi:hypothetical protein
VRQQSGRAGYRIVVVQLLDGVEQLVQHEFVQHEFVLLFFKQQFVDARLLELVVVQLLLGRFKFFRPVVLVERLADGPETRRIGSGGVSRLILPAAAAN